MLIGLIVWLLVLAGLNISAYMAWQRVKDMTGTGHLGDGLAFLVFFLVVLISDISTLVVWIF